MYNDALFQLGMGSVVLEATQTEDFSRARPARAGKRWLRANDVALAYVLARFLALFSIERHRGNSAKALILPV